MKALALRLLFVTMGAATLQAQQMAGVETNYEARNLIDASVKADQNLRQILEALHTQDWVNLKGAPGSYNVQWQSAQNQIHYVEQVSASLAQHIDDVPSLLDLYFRMESIELTARSLAQGAEQYAARPESEKLNRWIGQAFESRRRLREYISDAAASLEQNFKVADAEAQRCRAEMIKTPSSKKSRK